MCHELGTQHIARILPDFAGRPRQLDAARLAATTGMHLGLDDPEVAAEFGSCRDCVAWRMCRYSLGNRDAELCKKLLGLIFVKIHER